MRPQNLPGSGRPGFLMELVGRNSFSGFEETPEGVLIHMPESAELRKIRLFAEVAAENPAVF